MGMNRYLCEEKTTQLYLPQNASASRVWLVEPLVPGAPTIAGAAIVGGCKSGVLTVTLNPPEFAGYYAISNYTAVCTPARGPSLTASGPGRNVGSQVRPRRGTGLAGCLHSTFASEKVYAVSAVVLSPPAATQCKLVLPVELQPPVLRVCRKRLISNQESSRLA